MSSAPPISSPPGLQEVALPARAHDGLRDVLAPAAWVRFEDTLARARRLLAARTVWTVNSTAAGGGVAELLSSLLPYGLGAGLNARWLVIAGDPEFFTITKRLHNRIHGAPGDGGPLGQLERAAYERTLAANASLLLTQVQPGDVVLLHDPQTAGLIPAVRAAGAIVVWRCHVGDDRQSAATDEAWAFLGPYLDDAHAHVFSRAAYVPAALRERRVAIIQPSIDPLSPKNVDLDTALANAICEYAGITRDGLRGTPVFARRDGGATPMVHHADVLRTGPGPRLGSDSVITQVSRWDPLKDPAGVMATFVEHVLPHADAHLVLAGPTVHSVADDPEATRTFEDVVQRWRALSHTARSRVSLCCLPMRDLEENAVLVNALQRVSTVVVQKSRREGFGLTVAEAMWKARPVVASAVGGIADQIEDGDSGVLVADPDDLAAFGAQLGGLLGDRERRERLGAAARERVRGRFLHDRHLADLVDLLETLVAR